MRSFASSIALLVACSSETPARPPEPAPERHVAPAPAERSYVGLVVTGGEIDVAPEVPGRVAELLVRLGDRVNAGDVVTRLENRGLRHELARARAARSAAQADVRVARVRGAHARDLRDRIAALGDVASGAERSTAEHDAAAAQAQAASARGHSAERAADADLLQWRIEALEVRTEIAGRVAAEYVRRGDAIEAGEPIVRIVSDEVSLRFAVPASDASEVAIGSTVTVDASSACAVVRRIAPEIDRAGMILVETDPLASGAPVPGSVVRVRVATCGGES